MESVAVLAPVSEGMPKRPDPNDQRSNTKNPNNPANKAAADNRSNQMNPQHPASKGKNKK